ncbi:MAG: helix-turn-helix transcriptional regulator [Clostridia bacterium]|nr:helix-turn-helix transcriptional regulator [Clostridia bacterium]
MFYQTHHVTTGEFFKKERGRDFSYPPHLHQCYELVTLLKGSMTVTVSGTPYLVKAGEAILVFPHEIHSLSSESSEHMLFIFSTKLISAFATKYTDKLPVIRVKPLSDYLLSTLSFLEPESSLIEIKGALYTAAALFEKDTDFRSADRTGNELLSRIFSFVDENFQKECLLSDLAKELGYDNAYLSRYFKRATGIPYNNYVNICRLNHAGYLLRNTDISVLACAIESGYKSLRSFNRNFKQYFSVTPGEYKG